LTKTDQSAIAAQLAELSATMSAAGGSKEYIQNALAAEEAKLSETCKKAKHNARAAKKEIPNDGNKENVLPATREPTADDDGRDSLFGENGADLSNADYLARADDARQRILAHGVFKGILDELPLVITGSPAQRSGVQDCQPLNSA